MSSVPISVIIPSSGIRESLFVTLSKIQACNPPPAEILVHLDDAPSGASNMLGNWFPQVKVLSSRVKIGPGGGRQKLIEAASYELVASFDDDSFPEDTSYFARACEVADWFPEAAVISAASPGKEREMEAFLSIAVYSGCGCIFRRSHFLQIQGFVPLPIAYSMEEVDVSLQLYATGKIILHDPCLHVLHEHPSGESYDVKKRNATILANTLLLAWLRYPVIVLLSAGVFQFFSRILWMLKSSNTRGMCHGLKIIPDHLWRYRKFRSILPVRKVASWLLLRRHPVRLKTLYIKP